MKKSSLIYNWPLIGNDHITLFLEKIITAGQVSGTYILNGPDNLGKTTLAVQFARILLCQKSAGIEIAPCAVCPACKRISIELEEENEEDSQMEIGESHGDFHIIKKLPDKKNISIEQVREFIRTLNMSSFLNSYKIGIIKHADALSEEAANALLKTLEEPKDKVVTILVTHDLEMLPATIVSRSKVLNFHPVKTEIIYDYLVKEKKAARSLAINYSRLALGRPALAVKFLEKKDFFENYKQRADTFIDFKSQGINERFSAISRIINDKAGGQENVKLAKRTLEIWQGLVRDLILMQFNKKELLQHHLAEAEMDKICRKFSVSELVKLKRALRQAEENLSANVNPKLVLENVATYI